MIRASNDADVIVVGAGVCGITTARLLHDAGLRVIVLEARDRVGGRTHSLREHGRVTDLGASWIHGIEDSPVYAAAQALDMPMTEFTVGSYQVDGRPIAYFGPDASPLTSEEAAAFAADVHSVDRAIFDFVDGAESGKSYEEAITHATDQVAASEDWAEDRAERVREHLRHRSEEQYGVASSLLAAHGLYNEVIAGDEVVFPEGYDALAQGLARGLPDVRLSHVVTEVQWSAEHGVRVVTADAAFTSTKVVVTVPVGVLQSGDIAFTPPLPEPVAGALTRFQMNAFEKVFLQFDQKFWGEGLYALRRQGPAAKWWHSRYDLTEAHGEPTLLTFAAGPAALTTRNWSDDQIAQSVLTSLREIYGDAVPEPVGVRITRWQDDPFARGSYSFPAVSGKADDHEMLATPVAGVLHIAGEATWQDDPSTVTAAMCSGHRAAERVLGKTLGLGTLTGV